MNEHIKRIYEMEKAYEHAQIAVKKLESAIDYYASAIPDIKQLENYLNSEERRCDIEADEAGRLQCELRRGVLSEDGLWNLLEDNDRLKDHMKCIACPDEFDVDGAP